MCDLGSKNGVFLRGMRVLEAEVHSGDCLTLGRTEITVRYREASCGDGGPCAEEETDGDRPALASASPGQPAYGRAAILTAHAFRLR